MYLSTSQKIDFVIRLIPTAMELWESRVNHIRAAQPPKDITPEYLEMCMPPSPKQVIETAFLMLEMIREGCQDRKEQKC